MVLTDIVNLIQEIARAELGRLYIAEIATITKVYSDEAEGAGFGCDVVLRNSGLTLSYVPMVTTRIGSAATPNVGDTVLLTFSRGDLQQPIIVGRLYTDKVHAPACRAQEIVERLPFDGQIQEDEQIAFSARRQEGDESVHEVKLELPGKKVSIVINDESVGVELGANAAQLSLSNSDGKPAATLSINGGDASISLGEDGSVTIEAAGDLRLDASKGKIALSAQQIELSGKSKLSIAGGASAELKAANINVKGMTSFST